MAGGIRIVTLDEVDSTSDEARRQAAGLAPPFWVRADRQTKGRGRQGRTWVGLPGNLLISGLYRLSCPPGEAAQLSFAAALAVADVIDAHVDPRRVAFKWPNDVKLDGLKVAGVLLESAGRERGVELVVGVGLNLVDAPEGATAVASAGGDAPSAADAARRLVDAFEAWRLKWAEAGFAPLRTAWLARAEGLGTRVTAAAGDTRVDGVFEDLDAEGGLVMMTSGGRRTIRSGEVFFGAPGHSGGDASGQQGAA